jgi:hypothetical protein
VECGGMGCEVLAGGGRHHGGFGHQWWASPTAALVALHLRMDSTDNDP